MPKDSTKPKRKAAEKAEKPPPRSRKAKKDPNAPKRSLAPYMYFSKDWRERIKAENPDASFGEIGKLLGAKWKEMTPKEKQPYVDAAAADKARAEKEKTEYEKQNKKSASADEQDEEDD